MCMMRIEVLLFGEEARLAGKSRVCVEVATQTVEGVQEALVKAEMRLAERMGKCRWAVNQEYALLRQRVQPGDEVALIGPVSGG